jgi:hypothetical protein
LVLIDAIDPRTAEGFRTEEIRCGGTKLSPINYSGSAEQQF